jgi:hypothetical protein
MFDENSYLVSENVLLKSAYVQLNEERQISMRLSDEHFADECESQK